ALMPGGSPIPSGSGGGGGGGSGSSNWNNTWTMANPDGTTTTYVSSGSNTFSSSVNDSSSSSTWHESAVTSDAAGNVLASHVEDYTSLFTSHTASSSSLDGSLSTTFTSHSSGSD